MMYDPQNNEHQIPLNKGFFKAILALLVAYFFTRFTREKVCNL